MKKNKLNMVVAIALCVSLGLSSCIRIRDPVAPNFLLVSDHLN